MMRRVLNTLILIVLSTLPTALVAAQDNLLTNGGLEQGEFGPYSGRGRGDLTVPRGWDLWLGQGEISDNNFFNRGDKVFMFPHPGPGPAPVEGGDALNINGGFVQFNAAIFQSVNVASGTNLQAEAASNIKACDTPDGGPGFCGSDPSSGAQTRIGIDPDGGNDPYASDIVWSEWLTPHDRWDRQFVEATATGDTVTVFLFATQDKPYTNNQVYWDDAKLTVGGAGGTVEGGEEEGGDEPSAAPPPPPDTVPFVNPQGASDDGEIIHTVQQGDTLDSIAVAYGLSRQDLIDRNPGLASIRFLSIGQELVIQEASEPEPAEEPDEPDASDAADEAEDEPETVPGGVVEEESAPLPPGDESEGDTDAIGSDNPNDTIIAVDPKEMQTDDTDTDAAMTALDSIFGSDDMNAVPQEDEADTVANDEGDTAANDEGDTTGTSAAMGALMALFGNDDTSMVSPDDEANETTDETDETTDMTDEADETDETTDEAEVVADAAPVVEPESVPSVDVVASNVAVCVSMFEDLNQNRLREDNEALLGGGAVTILQDGTEVTSYQMDGTSEPHCLTDLNVGEYTASVSAPQGYGLTTSDQLRLPLTAGAALNIEIGAAEGVEVAAAPPADDAAPDNTANAAPVSETGVASLTDNLLAISGIIVAVLAGVVVITGIGAAVLIRRAS